MAEPSVLTPTCDPSPWEREGGRSSAEGHLQLCSDLGPAWATRDTALPLPPQIKIGNRSRTFSVDAGLDTNFVFL